MANYIVRVELMGEPGKDIYEQLHNRMKRFGFSMDTTNTQGQPLKLPHATYNGDSSVTTEALANTIRDTIQKEIWTKAKVLAVAWTSADLADPT